MSCFCFIFRRKRTLQQQTHQGHEDIPGIENVTIYPYDELRSATGDFSIANKVGEGGFGSVYRGRLKDGTTVAIKVLSSESKQGVREFLTELTVISGILHENLVRLYGCCVEGTHRILVYNYLENNSLAQTLLGSGHSNIQFNWRARVKICIGISRGLSFLHEEVQPRIVHRDIKASNILLDKDLTAKISDFGLAKFLPANTTHVSTRVAGTIGYLAPEYAVRGQVTRKSDVYSFGVLLLEIVSGRCNTNTRLPYEDQFLLEKEGSNDENEIHRGYLAPEYAVRGQVTRKSDVYSFGVLLLEIVSGRCNTNTGLPCEDQFLLEKFPDITHGLLILQTWALYEQNELWKIVDSFLTDDLDIEEACKFLKVGLLCTQDAAKLRPTMPDVIKMLTGEKDVESEKLTKPGLINDFMELKVRSRKNGDEAGTSTMSSAVETTHFSTENATYPSITFTEISERD